MKKYDFNDLINTLQMENGLILYDPMTGRDKEYSFLDDLNKKCYDAHNKIIEILSILKKLEEVLYD